MRKYQCDVSADNVPPVQSPAVGAPCRRDYQYRVIADSVRTHGSVACRRSAGMRNINAMRSPTTSAPHGPTACCRSALQARLLMPSIRHTGRGCE
jgi:hypothetical protein